MHDCLTGINGNGYKSFEKPARTCTVDIRFLPIGLHNIIIVTIINAKLFKISIGRGFRDRP